MILFQISGASITSQTSSEIITSRLKDGLKRKKRKQKTLSKNKKQRHRSERRRKEKTNKVTKRNEKKKSKNESKDVKENIIIIKDCTENKDCEEWGKLPKISAGCDSKIVACKFLCKNSRCKAIKVISTQWK